MLDLKSHSPHQIALFVCGKSDVQILETSNIYDILILNGLTADAADQDLKAFWLTKRVMRYSGLKRPQSMRDIYPDAVRAKPPPRYLEKEVGR